MGTNKHAVIGTWTNQDGLKQWNLLVGPMPLDEAKMALTTITPKKNCIDHDEFVVTWKVYKLMLKNLN